jgi:hypothetical protein
VRLDAETSNNPLYKLIRSKFCFNVDAQEVIQSKLPPPLVIVPEPGDLVILDSSRPHAVAGFGSGMRLGIQSFIVPKEADAPLEILS